MNIKGIFEDYNEELKAVDASLMDIFNSNVLLIPVIGKYILNSGGKRIRPLFLILSSELGGYRGERRSMLAAIIEAIHTASLLHDDVIDGAETRRGMPAANAVWGNQIVILVGDYLYSNALRLAVSQKDQEIMETLSNATTRMTEGEILQLHKTADPEITKDEYFEIISAKTGVLISAACRIGGILSGESEERKNALSRFGLKTGIAFQLADDILDYVAKQDDLGKKLGKDLEEGKITMPLIYLLKSASDPEKEEIKEIIKNQVSEDSRQKETGLKRIIDLFTKYNAIEESLKIARDVVEDAKSELKDFPSSKEKDAILALAEYSMQREK